jgi:hypothetical protein
MKTMKLRQMDDQVTYLQQLQEDGGPVVLINQFSLAPGDAEGFLHVWADDAAYMKQQPGFGSCTDLPQTRLAFNPVPILPGPRHAPRRRGARPPGHLNGHMLAASGPGEWCNQESWVEEQCNSGYR